MAHIMGCAVSAHFRVPSEVFGSVQAKAGAQATILRSLEMWILMMPIALGSQLCMFATWNWPLSWEALPDSEPCQS